MKKVLIILFFVVILSIYSWLPSCSKSSISGNYEIKHGVGLEYLSVDIERGLYTLTFFDPSGRKRTNSGKVTIRYSIEGWIVRFEDFIQGYEPRCASFPEFCEGLVRFFPDNEAQTLNSKEWFRVGDMAVVCDESIALFPWETGLGYVKFDGEIPDHLMGSRRKR